MLLKRCVASIIDIDLVNGVVDAYVVVLVEVIVADDILAGFEVIVVFIIVDNVIFIADDDIQPEV